MRRRRSSKVTFNTKLMVDVIGASLIVQQAPKLLGTLVGADPTMQTVAGVGAGYLTGYLLKRPDLANAAIALGAVQFISPFVDDLVGGGSTQMIPAGTQTAMVPPTKTGMVQVKNPTYKTAAVDIADFITLNDYVSNPSVRLPFSEYNVY